MNQSRISSFFVAAFLSTQSYYPVDLKVISAKQFYPKRIDAVVEVVSLPPGSEGQSLQLGQQLTIFSDTFLNHPSYRWVPGEILKRTTLSFFSDQKILVAQDPQTLPHTREDLEALSPDDLESLLSWFNWSGYHFLNGEFEFILYQSFESQLLPYSSGTQVFIRERLKDFSDYFEIEVDDEYYSKIGKPRLVIELLLLPNGDPVGVEVTAIQKGCSQMDENGNYTEESNYYDTEAEANAANCFDNDVSWSGHMKFDFSGRIVENSEYMEWTGH